MMFEDELLDDICCTAFEGGITYWCIKAEVIDNDYKGAEHASDAISKGASILLHDSEDDYIEDKQLYTLTKEKLVHGILLYQKKHLNHKAVDALNIDGNDADTIIQYALFGEQVYA